MEQTRLISCTCSDSFSKLYGREKELKEIDAVYEASRIPAQKVQCVFVGGLSGTGKSALLQRPFLTKQCLYGSGKFEQRKQANPYAALVHCISDICNQAHLEGTAKYKALITEQLQPHELKTLVEVFPDIGTLAYARPEVEETSAVHIRRRSKEGLEKLKYSLRLFLKAISLAECPVVMCLDDLHWIDPSTLGIIQSILSDHELSNLIFVGSFRDNDVSDALVQWMDEVRNAKRITTGDLSVDVVQDLLSDILRVDPVTDLAEFVVKQTNGNVFHVLQLIDYMQSEGLLEYSTKKFCWTWDINRLEEETSLSDNVVDIVSSRLNRLPPDVLACLKLCSCLSFRFDPAILHAVKDEVQDNLEMEITDVNVCLEKAIEEGVIQRLGNDRIKFTHDRLWQASLRLISSDEERERIHLIMGEALWKDYGLGCAQVQKVIDSKKLIVCVDQLNLGCRLIEDGNPFRLELARLNWEASKRVASLSAFVPSLEYLKRGIDLLDPKCRWTDHYNLSLEMFTAMSEMCFCAGRIEDCQKAVDQVLAHGKSIDESLRAHMVLIQSLSAQAKYDEFVNMSLELLDKLGEHIPPKPNTFITKRVFGRTQNLLQSKTDQEILSLPKMQNQHKAAAIQVMCDMMFPVDQIGRWNLITFLICRMLRITFEHGLAPYSALAFALASQLFVASQNDIDSGCRFAKLSVDMLKKVDDSCAARVFMHSGFALHWREPLSIIVDYWIDAHERGMRSGDLNAAVQNITGYGVAYFYSGLPLDPFVNDLENFCTLMETYGQKFSLLANVPVYQCVLNLTGRSENILDMSHGIAMDYRDKLGWESRTGEEAEWSFLMQLSFYCGDYEKATEMAEKVEALHAGASRALPLYHARLFFFCLIAIHNAKETGKRKYKVKAKKHYNVVQGWVSNQKAINVVHKLQILNAEMLTLEPEKKQKESTIMEAFDKAIAVSARAGFLQDAALTCQLASRAVTDKEEKREYFSRSLEFYRSWGAHGVAEYLETSIRRRRPSLLSQAGSSNGSITSGSSSRRGYRARERFDKSLSIKHTKIDIDNPDSSSEFFRSSASHTEQRRSSSVGSGLNMIIPKED